MGRIAIHCSPSIDWHKGGAVRFKRGLSALGIDAYITQNRVRESDIAVLLGTTLWRQIESTGRYLLVDRASVGDPHFVSLVWDGHGRRGDHRVPDGVWGRWNKFGFEVKPWRDGRKVVLCGQTETWSPHYRSVEDWYKVVQATHFRSHPAGDNPTGLPRTNTWDDVGLAITLNSSVGVDAVLNGVPTVTMDDAAMAWDVSIHDPNASYDISVLRPDRRPWLEWLAWTQWHWQEIEDGHPISHLFEDI